MAHPSLHVIARFVALPDKVEGLQNLLLSLIEPTRQETGCIKYELLQNQSNPVDFTFVEEWASHEAFAAHQNTTHIKELLPQLEGLLATKPELSVYNLVV